MQAGFAQTNITPARMLPLAGIPGARPGRAVLDDLFVRAVWFEQGGARAVLLSCDLLYVSRQFCAALEDWADQKLGLAAANLFVAATHTHGSPQIRETFDGVPVDDAYLDQVQAAARQAIEDAARDATAARLAFGAAPAPIAINRRRAILDPAGLKRLRLRRAVANRPNPAGPVDDLVRVIWVHRTARPSIALIAAACHPSIVRGAQVSGDFPGRLGRHLGEDGEHSAVIPVFLQGFSGNLRARVLCTRASFAPWPPGAMYASILDRDRFRKDSSEADLDHVAGAIADTVRGITPRPVAAPELSAQVHDIELPLERLAERRTFEAAAATAPAPTRAYARFVLDRYDRFTTIPFRMRRLSLAPHLHILGWEGEVFCEYALWLRAALEDADGMIVPVGVVGGMAGYIPDADSLRRGGYEVDLSRPKFGLPARFAAEIEPILREAARRLLADAGAR